MELQISQCDRCGSKIPKVWGNQENTNSNDDNNNMRFCTFCLISELEGKCGNLSCRNKFHSTEEKFLPNGNSKIYICSSCHAGEKMGVTPALASHCNTDFLFRSWTFFFVFFSHKQFS